MNVSVYCATSLDGYIARPDGSLDWLPGADADAESAGNDYGYQAFMDSVDALVMGRHTFETVLSFGQWPYGKKAVFVLSQSLKTLPTGIPDTVHLKSDSPDCIFKDLERSGYKNIYVDGGNTIQRCLRAGLVDDLIITTIPVLIGSGISLFGDLETDIKLRLVKSQFFDNGFVQNHYRVLH